jgi:hypothetical protein
MLGERARACLRGGGPIRIAKLECRTQARPIAFGVLVSVCVLAAVSGRTGASADKSRALRLAQRTDTRIAVVSPLVAEPSSQISLRIDVGRADALPAQSFVRLRGLPDVISLTDGYSVGPGSWSVPLHALPALKMNVPAGLAGYSEFFVSLIAVDGTVLAEASAVLIVAAQTPEPQDRSTLVPLPARATPQNRNKQEDSRPATLSGEARERAEQLVIQGDRYLAEGKVAGARLFFRQAADAGLVAAVIRLAATYDPSELARLQVQGIAPDPAEARKWYERARELGAPEAEERLARLAGK